MPFLGLYASVNHKFEVLLMFMSYRLRLCSHKRITLTGCECFLKT